MYLLDEIDLSLSLPLSACDVALVGQRSLELIVFDILKDHVSIHQPLPRVIASESHMAYPSYRKP